MRGPKLFGSTSRQMFSFTLLPHFCQSACDHVFGTMHDPEVSMSLKASGSLHIFGTAFPTKVKPPYGSRPALEKGPKRALSKYPLAGSCQPILSGVVKIEE